MVDIAALQNIQQYDKLVKPDGTPTEFFMRILQARSGASKSIEEQIADLTAQLDAKAEKSTQIIAGDVLTGGGDLSTDRTIDHDTSLVTPGSYTNANITVDEYGHVQAAANGSGGGGGGGGGFFDISAGVPLMSALTTLNVPPRFAFTENAGKALNVKNLLTTSGISIAGFLDSLPVGDFHYAALVLPNQARRRYYGPFVGIRDAATSRVQGFAVISHASGGAGTVGVMNFNNENSRNSVVVENNETIGFPVPWYWLHVKRIGTTIYYGWSTDGANPIFYFNYSQTSWLANPTQFFFGAFCESDSFLANQSWTYLCYDKNADARVMGA